MRLICVSRYRSGAGQFEPGQDVDVTDDVAEFLLRDSPGSFKLPDPPRTNTDPEPEPDATPDITAISTETETGIVAPDRRARGGRKRGKS